jgi:hypothetical protein
MMKDEKTWKLKHLRGETESRRGRKGEEARGAEEPGNNVAKSREGRNFTSQQESNVAASTEITKENGTHREISF